LIDLSFLPSGKGSLSRGDPVGFRLVSEEEEEKEEELLMDMETYDEVDQYTI
jgi:hypothetical protein